MLPNQCQHKEKGQLQIELKKFSRCKLFLSFLKSEWLHYIQCIPGRYKMGFPITRLEQWWETYETRVKHHYALGDMAVFTNTQQKLFLNTCPILTQFLEVVEVTWEWSVFFCSLWTLQKWVCFTCILFFVIICISLYKIRRTTHD